MANDDAAEIAAISATHFVKTPLKPADLLFVFGTREGVARLKGRALLGPAADDWIRALEFSPDGTQLAVGGDNGACILEQAGGGGGGAWAPRPAQPPGKLGDRVYGVAWTPDGAHLLLGLRNGTALLVAAIPPAHRFGTGVELFGGADAAFERCERPSC